MQPINSEGNTKDQQVGWGWWCQAFDVESTSLKHTGVGPVPGWAHSEMLFWNLGGAKKFATVWTAVLLAHDSRRSDAKAVADAEVMGGFVVSSTARSEPKPAQAYRAWPRVIEKQKNKERNDPKKDQCNAQHKKNIALHYKAKEQEPSAE